MCDDMQHTYSIKKIRRRQEEDYAEGMCCIAVLNFFIFAVPYNKMNLSNIVCVVLLPYWFESVVSSVHICT